MTVPREAGAQGLIDASTGRRWTGATAGGLMLAPGGGVLLKLMT